MGEGKNKKIAMIVCILLSFSLWLYVINVENPSKIITVSDVEVQIVNADSLKDKGLVLDDEGDYTIDLKIEASAKQAYSVNKEDFKIQVNLAEYALKIGENNIPIEFVYYPDGITIKNDNSLSIKINIEKLVKKQMDVVSNVNINYADGYYEESKVISPKTVTVSGAETQIDKVSKVALIGEESDVNKNLTNNYNLVPLDEDDNKVEGVSLSKETGSLEIKVSAQKQIPVKVNTTGNLKDGITLKEKKLSIDKIYISGNNDNMKNIESISTENIDISNIDKTTTLKAKLIIPDGVNVKDNINEVNVTFVVEDNAQVTKVINNVPIIYTDKLSKFTYEMPNGVDITISGTSEEVNKITSNDISVEASLKSIEEEGTYEILWNATLNSNENITLISTSGKVSVITKNN